MGSCPALIKCAAWPDCDFEVRFLATIERIPTDPPVRPKPEFFAAAEQQDFEYPRQVTELIVLKIIRTISSNLARGDRELDLVAVC